MKVGDRCPKKGVLTCCYKAMEIVTEKLTPRKKTKSILTNVND